MPTWTIEGSKTKGVYTLQDDISIRIYLHNRFLHVTASREPRIKDRF